MCKKNPKSVSVARHIAKIDRGKEGRSKGPHALEMRKHHGECAYWGKQISLFENFQQIQVFWWSSSWDGSISETWQPSRRGSAKPITSWTVNLNVLLRHSSANERISACTQIGMPRTNVLGETAWLRGHVLFAPRGMMFGATFEFVCGIRRGWELSGGQ